MRNSELKTNIDNFIDERLEESRSKIFETEEYKKENIEIDL